MENRFDIAFITFFNAASIFKRYKKLRNREEIFLGQLDREKISSNFKKIPIFLKKSIFHRHSPSKNRFYGKSV